MNPQRSYREEFMKRKLISNRAASLHQPSRMFIRRKENASHSCPQINTTVHQGGDACHSNVIWSATSSTTLNCLQLCAYPQNRVSSTFRNSDHGFLWKWVGLQSTLLQWVLASTLYVIVIMQPPRLIRCLLLYRGAMLASVPVSCHTATSSTHHPTRK